MKFFKIQSVIQSTVLAMAMLSNLVFADSRLEQLSKQLSLLSFAQHKSDSKVLGFQTQNKPSNLFCRAHDLEVVDLHQTIEEVAKQHNIPPEIISAIMSIESNFNPCAISKSGALGLMQLMPKTAKSLGVNVNSGEVFDIETNINAGVKLLKQNLIRENNNLFSALVMYNAGSKYLLLNWNHWQKETQDYLTKFTREVELINKEGWKQRVPKFVKQSSNEAHGPMIIKE
ncbi:MAG: hypothetical protein ACI9YH_000154 [Colwellia sp.]|jgi:hypothetical protein